MVLSKSEPGQLTAVPGVRCGAAREMSTIGNFA